MVAQIIWAITFVLAQVDRPLFIGANWQSPSLPKSSSPLGPTQQTHGFQQNLERVKGIMV